MTFLSRCHSHILTVSYITFNQGVIVLNFSVYHKIYTYIHVCGFNYIYIHVYIYIDVSCIFISYPTSLSPPENTPSKIHQDPGVLKVVLLEIEDVTLAEKFDGFLRFLSRVQGPCAICMVNMVFFLGARWLGWPDCVSLWKGLILTGRGTLIASQTTRPQTTLFSLSWHEGGLATLKLNSSHLIKLPGPKRTIIVFQPSFFRASC